MSIPHILPIGIRQPDGTVLRDFALARPTAEIRGELANTTTYGEMDLAALLHVLRSIGTIDRPNAQIVRRLTQPDRDFVHMLCLANKYKGQLPVKGKCTACGEPWENSVSAIQVPLKAGGDLVWEETRACYQVEFVDPLSESVVHVLAAVPTVDDAIQREAWEAQLTAAKESGNWSILPPDLRTRGDLLYLITARGVVKLNGATPPSASDLKKWDLDSFDALREAMAKMPVPELDSEVLGLSCGECGASQPAAELEFDRWLLPLARPTGPKS